MNTNMPPRLSLPTRTTPDWREVAEHVAKHGPVFIDDPLIKYNAAHASLHRYGMGLYKCPHGGWVVDHLKRKDMIDAQDTGLWASILAEAPEAKAETTPPMHRPVRLGDTVYTLRPDTKGCDGCVADYSDASVVRDGPEHQRRYALCSALPNCDHGTYHLFEPSDYAIMVAKGGNDD